MRFWKRSQKPPAIRLDREGSADAELSPAEIERLMEDSVNGDPVARCKLGRFWLERGTELEAMNYFRHAAYQGHKPGWLEIGAMCGNECGVPGTHEDVAKWYMRAAYTGHPTAQLALAGLYREGLGVDADPVECTRLCRLSAEQGGLDAQYLLSLSYEFGTGVKADAEKATKWLSIAAERGHPDAQVRLEEKYRSGVGFRVDADERTRLLTGPAEPGDLAKIAVLAEAHATDSASKENLEEACEVVPAHTSNGKCRSLAGIRNHARLKGRGDPALPFPCTGLLLVSCGRGPLVRCERMQALRAPAGRPRNREVASHH